MEPQTPISSVGNSPLDPQAVNLAKAIRQTESGGDFSAKGKSGEFGGYQFTPDTWNQASKEAGVNVPLDQASPEQQNQVAYTRIKKWKDEGYNPGQIASMWNAGQGEPNAYTGKFSNGQSSEGVNKKGVDYSVPDYVQAVNRNYQALKGGGVSQPQQSNQQPPDNQGGGFDLMSTLGGIGAGALGWLGMHLGTAAKVGLPIAGGAVGAYAGGPEGAMVGEGIGSALANAIPGESNNGGANSPPSGGTSAPETNPPENNILQSDFAQSAAASSAIKDAIMQTMQGTKSERVFSNSDKGQNAIDTAAQFGLIHPDDNGNLIFDEQRARNAEKQINDMDDKIIAAEGGKGAMISVSNHAGNYIGGASQYTDLDRQKAAEIVQKNLEATRIPINGEMDLTAMRERQKQHYAAASKGYGKGLTTPEILAHKALGNAYGETIGQHLKNPELHKKALSMEKNLINARELGKKIQGKRPPKNNGLWEMFLRQGARAAEIYIGDKLGGPIGAIIGGLVGEHLNRKIEQRYGRNIFETKQMRAAMDILHEAKPKEYQELVSALKKQGIPFEPEKEPESDTPQEKVQDVQGDLKTIGKKGLVSRKKKPKKGLVKRRLKQNGAELYEGNT